MRKIFAILILGIVIVTTACADNDVITRNLNELPAPARTILKQQFAHTKVSYIKIDKDWFKSTTYDVQLCQWYGSLLRQQRRLDGSRRQKV